MRSYEVARNVFSFIEFCGWALVVIGGVVGIGMAASVSEYGGAGATVSSLLVGGSIAFAGLVSVAFVQAGRATVDTAEYTQQMLQIARDQLEVSRQGLKQDDTSPQSYVTAVETDGGNKTSGKATFTEELPEPKPASNDHSVTQNSDDSIEYRGVNIVHVGGNYLVGGTPYRSVDFAKKAIDRSLK
ncbi:hypothetical protein [Roseovarius nitratireducens]|uniref:hypothetical protein n=1 Tax=Roseovarius nitratireducens TaxID=2044597 RepID=UPI000CE1A900|nr:hypothetical protein [Roseovarius nitratireducens]